MVQEKTGLLLDPYFSATKIAWILDNVPGARQQAEAGELLFGTVESFLVWRFTKGKVHVTDITNASRTMLMNIHTGQWDEDLLKLFDVPKSLLPTIVSNAEKVGETSADFFGAAIPIAGMAGDQQAALIGQACIHPGMLKLTLGSGAFLMLNTGEAIVQSRNQLLGTVAYQVQGRTHYALEGSIFNAGTIISWLRDELQLIKTPAETEALAASTENNGGVYFVPAFTGLGAPHWRADVRGALLGLTRATDKAHIVRAALESIVYQLCDVQHAMEHDAAQSISEIRADGGLTRNAWLLQFMANMMHLPIFPAEMQEATCYGASLFAGIGAGCYANLEEAVSQWKSSRQYVPAFDAAKREALYEAWCKAIQRLL